MKIGRVRKRGDGKLRRRKRIEVGGWIHVRPGWRAGRITKGQRLVKATAERMAVKGQGHQKSRIISGSGTAVYKKGMTTEKNEITIKGGGGGVVGVLIARSLEADAGVEVAAGSATDETTWRKTVTGIVGTGMEIDAMTDSGTETTTGGRTKKEIGAEQIAVETRIKKTGIRRIVVDRKLTTKRRMFGSKQVSSDFSVHAQDPRVQLPVNLRLGFVLRPNSVSRLSPTETTKKKNKKRKNTNDVKNKQQL